MTNKPTWLELPNWAETHETTRKFYVSRFKINKGSHFRVYWWEKCIYSVRLSKLPAIIPEGVLNFFASYNLFHGLSKAER